MVRAEVAGRDVLSHALRLVPHRRLQRSLRATFLGMVTNAVLTTAKMAAGIVGHSHALVADAVESLADVVSSLVVWRGVVVAAEPADAEHPYGHGKAEPLSSAVVATMLLAAALWIVVESIRGILRPDKPPAPFTLAVLLVVVVVKEFLFRFVRKEGHEVESALIRTDAWHHRSDAITSAFAFVGITVALVGGPRYAAADNYAAILAAFVIAYNGSNLLRPAMDELMDTSPGSDFQAQIQKIASEIGEVQRVEKCLVRKMGYQYFVDMHIEVDPSMPVSRAHDIAHQVKNRIRAAIPEVADVLVHIEPAQ
jgi:cation diffusion facilitator family transporter